MQKSRVTYIDHDRTEVDSDDADSNFAWPGFEKSRRHAGSKKSSRSLIADESSGHVSLPGPYDSPYASPPGPYDSPESDTEKEESISEKVLTRFVCRFLLQVVFVAQALQFKMSSSEVPFFK